MRMSRLGYCWEWSRGEGRCKPCPSRLFVNGVDICSHSARLLTATGSLTHTYLDDRISVRALRERDATRRRSRDAAFRREPPLSRSLPSPSHLSPILLLLPTRPPNCSPSRPTLMITSLPSLISTVRSLIPSSRSDPSRIRLLVDSRSCGGREEIERALRTDGLLIVSKVEWDDHETLSVRVERVGGGGRLNGVVSNGAIGRVRNAVMKGLMRGWEVEDERITSSTRVGESVGLSMSGLAPGLAGS